MYFEELLKNLYACIRNKQYYAALTLALIIPDVCSQVLCKLEKGDKDHYIQWVREYVCIKDDYAFQYHFVDELSIDPRVIYSLRNHMFHSGLPEIKHKEIEKFYFEFNESNHKYRRYMDNTGFTKISINVPYLCNILYEAGREFYSKHKGEFPIGNDFREVMPDYMYVK